MSWHARVPGKAVLIGEYAVTDGLPGFAMATTRGARLHLCPSTSGRGRVVAPQLRSTPYEFSVDSSGQLHWDRGRPGWDRFAMTAGWIERLLARYAEPCSAFELTIDTSELFLDHDGQRIKLGLGSSAAVLVGLDAVFDAWQGGQERSPADTLGQLLPIYRDGQGGQGSGVDLACSIHGGLIEFQLGSNRPEVRACSFPDELSLTFVWTGQSASTPALLRSYRAWQHRNPDQFQDWLNRAGDLLQRTGAALAHQDAHAVVELLRAYGRAMSTIGRLMGVELTPGIHQALMHRADDLGLAAKPSGAGVGDLALVAGTDHEAMQALQRWALEQGHALVKMKPAPSDLPSRTPD